MKAKLVNEETGVELVIGQEVLDFRGDKMTLLGFTPPKHAGSTGRVTVQEEGKEGRREYYPSVIGAKIITE
jgi:hypothetical protein